MVCIIIQTGLNITYKIIQFNVVCIFFSFLAYFNPFKLGIFSFPVKLVVILFILLNVFLEFKNSYLKYSNDLAKCIIQIIAFICSLLYLFLQFSRSRI